MATLPAVTRARGNGGTAGGAAPQTFSPVAADVQAALDATEADWNYANNPVAWPKLDDLLAAMADHQPEARRCPSQSDAYWIKCAGLYPSYEDMDQQLAQHNMMAYNEYSDFAHKFMIQVFESKGEDDIAIKNAADVIGSKGGPQAMIGVFYGFLHGMGMAYAKSGWDGGRAASTAMDEMRLTLSMAWDGVHGFSASML
jgi:hypothetical protein